MRILIGCLLLLTLVGCGEQRKPHRRDWRDDRRHDRRDDRRWRSTADDADDNGETPFPERRHDDDQQQSNVQPAPQPDTAQLTILKSIDEKLSKPQPPPQVHMPTPPDHTPELVAAIKGLRDDMKEMLKKFDEPPQTIPQRSEAAPSIPRPAPPAEDIADAGSYTGLKMHYRRDCKPAYIAIQALKARFANSPKSGRNHWSIGPGPQYDIWTVMDTPPNGVCPHFEVIRNGQSRPDESWTGWLGDDETIRRHPALRADPQANIGPPQTSRSDADDYNDWLKDQGRQPAPQPQQQANCSRPGTVSYQGQPNPGWDMYRINLPPNSPTYVSADGQFRSSMPIINDYGYDGIFHGSQMPSQQRFRQVCTPNGCVMVPY